MADKLTDLYTHQKKYNAKMESSGLRRVTVWVPDEDIERLTKYAAGLRKAVKV